MGTGATLAGGIGTVVVCTDTNLDRKVAIKFVQPGGEHRRLLDELAALQRIRSKHVVQIFDVDHFDSGPRMGIIGTSTLSYSRSFFSRSWNPASYNRICSTHNSIAARASSSAEIAAFKLPPATTGAFADAGLDS